MSKGEEQKGWKISEVVEDSVCLGVEEVREGIIKKKKNCQGIKVKGKGGNVFLLEREEEEDWGAYRKARRGVEVICNGERRWILWIVTA